MDRKKNQTALSGKRKEIAQVNAIRYPGRWAESLSGKQAQVRDWRYIAMQLLHRNTASFRLVAIIDDVFDFDECQVLKTDEGLALAAGHCGKKTIQRELSILYSLGLILKDEVWIDRSGNGKRVRTRRIRLAIPMDVSGIHLRDF
ncbi:hypothetical protein G6L12_08190 [Agrobacterium rhizogenes]|nr:hypothetical protein [Rhizobium rhizogenes]NTF74452.1 hypothetical protein [Rhizobium rhizogenes]